MRARGKNRIIRYSGVFAASLLVTLAAVYFYSPTAGTHADEINVGLGVSSFIAISTDTDRLSLETTVNSFVSGVITPSVSTNSAYGHTMRISAVGDDTSMTSETSSDIVTSSFAGQLTEENMPVNSWGLSLNNTNYRRIPVQSSAVNISTSNAPSAASATSVPVRIGAKVGMLTSGTYHSTLLFTAYTNGVDGKPTTEDEDPNWTGEDDGIDPLQKFVCSMLSENGVTATFKDSRDGRQYRVARLRDGQCWMVDNLAIANKTITSADSDVVNSFTIPESVSANFRTGVHILSNGNIWTTGYYNYVNMLAGDQSKDENGVFQHSICPKGWRLASNDDYTGLTNLYTYNELLSNPVNIVLSGNNVGGAVAYQNQYGSYWTSTYRNSDTGHYFSIGNNKAYLEWQWRHAGYSIRCIARN